MDDNSIQMKKDLEKFLYQLRMQAEVHIIEMVMEGGREGVSECSLLSLFRVAGFGHISLHLRKDFDHGTKERPSHKTEVEQIGSEG